MTRLFIAEKPSVARDLARALGASRRMGDHFEGTDPDGHPVRVAWCIGHLVEPAAPDEHDPRWKRWDPAVLPMLPRALELKPAHKTRAHLKALIKQMNRRDVSEVVNACDAGREGELIFRYVYALGRCSKPTRRFWVSSLTPGAIKSGLARLRPGADFDALAAAARCRAEADWLVGMNATRGLTSRAGTLLSVGRVQTPTLAMVVAREREIEDFKTEPYFEVFAELDSQAPERPGRWTARWVGPVGERPAERRASEKQAPESRSPGGADKRSGGLKARRLPDKASADAIVAALKDQTGEIARVERTKQTVPPPQLHHLTSLQQVANRRYGLTAQQTLKAAQSLYERHKLITYPRTDARHLTKSDAGSLPGVVRAVARASSTPWGPYADDLMKKGLPRLGRRFVDDSKVGDHPAIVPTAVSPDPSKLNRDEQRIYDLVVRQLLGALSPPAIYARTVIEAHVNGHRLVADGRVCLEPGFEAINPPPRKPASGRSRKPEGADAASGRARKGGGKVGADEAVQTLPAVEQGDPVAVEKARAERKETRPPPRYTEASLLGAMERAGRSLDEAHLRAAMRECGLGTPATRAGIIETLLRRDYMARQGKSLVPSTAGRALIEALPIEMLKSPRLTGEWESRLQAIAEGRGEAMAFRRDIRRFVTEAISSILAAPRVEIPAEARRPARGRKAGGRRATSPRTASRKPANRKQTASRSTASRSTASRSGAPRSAPSRTGTSRPATSRPASSANSGASHSSQADPRQASEAPRCPACQQGHIIRGRQAWGCDRWREGCRMVVRFSFDGVVIPEAEAHRLFSQGRTEPFAPVGDRRRRLVLDPEAEGHVRWG